MIGLKLKKVKFGPENKEIIDQVQSWIDNANTNYVKRRLFNGEQGSFRLLVEDSLGSRVKRQSAYAYLHNGEVIGIVLTTEIELVENGHSTMNITTICANPSDPSPIIETEIISDLKACQAKVQMPDIFSDFSYVNKDLAKVFAENGFHIIEEDNNIHAYYQLEKTYEKTL